MRNETKRAITGRIGPRMEAVIEYVATHPGCCKLDSVRALSYSGRMSLRYGYAAVDRAISRGLIVASVDPAHRGRYRLFPPDVGQSESARSGQEGGTNGKRDEANEAPESGNDEATEAPTPGSEHSLPLGRGSRPDHVQTP